MTPTIRKPNRCLKICISIRPDLNDQIVKLQEKQLSKTGKNYSYSKAVSDILEEAFKS